MNLGIGKKNGNLVVRPDCHFFMRLKMYLREMLKSVFNKAIKNGASIIVA